MKKAELKLKEEQAKNTEKAKVDVSPNALAKKPTKAEFERIIAAYKLQNPVKYEHKKAAFEKQLAELS